MCFSTNVTASRFYQQPKFMFGLWQPGWSECGHSVEKSHKVPTRGMCQAWRPCWLFIFRIRMCLKTYFDINQNKGFCWQKPVYRTKTTGHVPNIMAVTFGGICVIAIMMHLRPFRDGYISSAATTPMVFRLISIVMCASDLLYMNVPWRPWLQPFLCVFSSS